MNVYFNAEYTGTNSDAALISLGCIAENGQKLYIEFMDVPSYLVSSYVRDSVYPDTYIHDPMYEPDEGFEVGKQAANEHKYQYWATCIGHAGTILLKWFDALLQSKEDREEAENIQLISYCSHYDSCLLFNLFGGDIPSFIVNPICYDIFYDVMKYLGLTGNNLSLYYRVEQALKCDLKQLAIEKMNVEITDYKKNHSLSYAEIIKSVYEKLHQE